MNNFIKIDRKILKWEWWPDINTFRLFMYMLLAAWWKDGKYKGNDIFRGSFPSSIAELSKETNLTENEIRTAIKHLKSTGEITSKSHSKYTVFTVKNYDAYQSNHNQNYIEITGEITSTSQPVNEQLTSKSQAVNKQITNIPIKKEIKNIRSKEYKEDTNVSKKKEQAVYFPDNEKLNEKFCEFVDMRKKIKAPMTDNAIRLALSKLEKLSNGDTNIAIEILNQSIIGSYRGLFPLKNASGTVKQKPNAFHNFEQRNNDFDDLEAQLDRQFAEEMR